MVKKQPTLEVAFFLILTCDDMDVDNANYTESFKKNTTSRKAWVI